MDEELEWFKNRDNNWVNLNLSDIERSLDKENKFFWDAQGFGGVLSFVDFFLLLYHKNLIPNEKLDTNFMQDPLIISRLADCLESMQLNQQLRNELNDSWSEWDSMIESKLAKLYQIMD